MNYQINKQKYCIRYIEDETILLCFENGLSHKLDNIATIMFKLIEEFASDDKVFAELIKLFPDEDKNMLKNDYFGFVITLLNNEIVTIEASN